MSDSVGMDWEQYKLAVEQTYTDMGLLGLFVHGDENTLVLLGGKNTPSIRNLVSEIKTAQNGLINDGVVRIQAISDQAAQSAVNAAIAKDQAAQAAVNAATAKDQAAQAAADARAEADRLEASMDEVEIAFALLEPGVWNSCLCALKRANAAVIGETSKLRVLRRIYEV